MTPKTPSVCKHCRFTEAQHPNSNTSIMGYPHIFDPVAEPASTGEPRLCDICGVEIGIKHGHAGHTFQPPAARPSEPSAPYTEPCLRDRIKCVEPWDKGSREMKEMILSLPQPPAPQTSAEPTHKGLCQYCKCGKRVFFDGSLSTENWRHFDGGSVACSQSKADFYWRCPTCNHPAAPQPVSGPELCPTCGKPPFCGCPTQPVSGDAPEHVDEAFAGMATDEAYQKETLKVAGEMGAAPCPTCGGENDTTGSTLEEIKNWKRGDAPKVEEIDRWLDGLFGEGNGVPLELLDAGRFVFKGKDRQWKIAELIQAFASDFLRPYLPHASQTPSEYWPVNVCAKTEQALKKLLDRNRDGSEEYKVCAQLLGDIHYSSVKPASTARTDGWVSVEASLPSIRKVDYDDFSESVFVLILLKDGRQAIAQYCEWIGNKHPSMWDEYSGSSHEPNEVTHWRELPAAPGSVLCNDPDCGDCYDKPEALEHAQKGVPQSGAAERGEMTIPEMLDAANNEIQAAKSETCSTVDNRLIDALEMLHAVVVHLYFGLESK